MNPSRITIHAFIVALALSTTACSEQVQQAVAEAKSTIEQATAEGGSMVTAMEEARRKLREENLRLGIEGQTPMAEITPQGELLINGIAIPMTEAQRMAASSYREQVIAVADAGMSMGQDGIAFTGLAVSTKVAGILSGNADAAIARIEAESKNMELAALAVCEQMKGLETAQATLVALVPEFAPYAKVIDIATLCKSETPAEEATPAQ